MHKLLSFFALNHHNFEGTEGLHLIEHNMFKQQFEYVLWANLWFTSHSLHPFNSLGKGLLRARMGCPYVLLHAFVCVCVRRVSFLITYAAYALRPKNGVRWGGVTVLVAICSVCVNWHGDVMLPSTRGGAANLAVQLMAVFTVNFMMVIKRILTRPQDDN